MLLKDYDKFYDARGQLYTCWDDREYDITFVQDRISHSKFNTIRGFHGDEKTWKLIMCIYGSLKLVTFNLDTRQTETVILSHTDDFCKTILVPPRTLNAHQVLSTEAVLLYKWSEYYSGPENQISIYYNDPMIDPEWEMFYEAQIVSPRDQQAPTLKEYYGQKH